MDDAISDLFSAPPETVGEGRYVLGGQLGMGAVAQVFRSVDQKTGRTVAVKIMPVPHGKRKVVGTRFLAEAKVMAEIRHPNIPRVHKAGREGAWYWFAMDLARGGSLAQKINADGPMSEPEALRIAFQLASALHIVHERGLVHRDVKPDNVLLDEDQVLLADFGIARHPEGTVPLKTMPGQLLGTRGYRAPEQEDNAHEVSAESDLYGVVATLYIMLAGKKPRRLWDDPGFADGFSPPVAAMMRRGAAPDPADRFPSALAMGEALAEAAGHPEWMESFVPVDEPPPGLLSRFASAIRSVLGGSSE